MKNSRKLQSAIAIVLMIVTLFTFGGCDIIMEQLGIKDVLTITATYMGEPIEVGGTLDKKYIVVEATLLKGITHVETTYVVTNFQVSPFDSSTPGDKTLQVLYTELGMTVGCSVVVPVVKKAVPVSISATYTGKDIPINGTLDKSDFNVVVTYDNGTTKPADSFSISTIDTTSTGEKHVTITYGYVDSSAIKTFTTTVKVNVVATLVGISASFVGEPLQEGDTFTKDRLLVQEVYDDGTKVTITDFEISTVDTSTAGTKTVVVSYQKNGQTYTANAQFSVVEEPVVLTGISATFANDSFSVGDTLTTSDFTVTAVYSDSNTSVVTNFTITGDTTFTTSGNHTVTLSYTHEGVTKTCNVIFEVLPEPITFVGISATFVGQPIQEGETLTKDHFLVHELYSDDSKINVTNFTFNSVDTSTAGTKQVTITYQKDGQTYTAFVDVKVVAEPVVLTGITATFANSKFYVGDTLTTHDFVVSASYSDHHDGIVTNFTIIGETTFTTSGNHTVTLSYTHQDVTKTCDVTVVVLSKLTGITAQFTNSEFYVGDTLTADDFVVIATFVDEQAVSVADFSINGAKTFDTDGEHTTTISYTFQGITRTCSVTVQVLPVPVTLTSISATFNVAKFYVGDTLENSNFAVTATFSNGSKANILNFTITSPTTFTTSGNHTVTLSYTHEGVTKTCNVTINVLQELTLTGITAKATHSDFEVGEQLRLADFVVTAQFSNDSSFTVSDFTIVEPTGTLENAGQVEVELSYTFNGQTHNTTLYINVTEVQADVVNYGMHGILSKDGKSVKVANTAKVVDTTDLQIHFLELGNKYTGDSIYIKAGDTDILIDAGSRQNSATTIKNYINKYVTDGILEYVIATHADRDHIAGMVGNSTASGYNGILYSYKVKTLIQFPLTSKSKLTDSGNLSLYGNYLEAVEYAESKGANAYTALECWNSNNESTRFEQSINETGARRYYKLSSNVEMEILYNYYYENKTSDENDYSVCIMFNQYGENYDFNNPSNPENEKHVNHFLFTGDLEESGEEHLVQYNNLPEVVLYKAGHHGSKTSSTAELLSVIKPKVVCVCCCTGSNEYTPANENQFPTQLMIDRVAPYTDLVFATTIVSTNSAGYTSLNGNITLTCNNLGINITASNNVTLLKDTAWFKANRTCPTAWK